jgi:predicted adenine nucleotide alpha hydrolase (AANH) superfamily ATPase
MKRPRLLLHVCCGPCATAVYERLAAEYEVTLYWFNPNIEPVSEYQRRLAAARQLADAWGLAMREREGGAAEFEAVLQGREEQPEGGPRCRLCYELRLQQAVAEAAEGDFPYVTTTLSISPHKPAVIINAVGEALAARQGCQWVSADFKKADGFARSVALSRELGLYRQNTCGCRASWRSDSQSQ